ncbi:uncharacterized protein PV09_07205 [Verruconis gallopava]|uniref:Uncharacterized protein n=1 Tax=Verruconis gallopava TaxID=253628 RepID=A0A0D1YKV0_9PEZI|nr:uncharacterized protein PV09_07205 [Verruconis gallopava]KIW01447.1 hypothetical protein PV09_07205 [Verruconis gallopava]
MHEDPATESKGSLDVPDEQDDGSPATKSSATANIWAKPMPDPAYDPGEQVFVSALCTDGKMRRVEAKILERREQGQRWEYKLATPAENRWYKENEIE